jgi:hypothetical protein
MFMFRVMGLFAIIPAALLLTISFFVLFSLRKTETPSLRAFGYCLAILLWVAVAMVISLGLYTVSTGCHPMTRMMKEVCGPMHGMKMKQMPQMMPGQRQMMREKAPATMQGE